jgi:hypothetical protein
MNSIIFVFVGVMCLYVGIKILSSEERTTVYNKRPIEVTDIKKYNQCCGWLTIGFGVVADITIALMGSFTGWLSVLCTVALIVEAFIVLKIYAEIEKRMLKKR